MDSPKFIRIAARSNAITVGASAKVLTCCHRLTSFKLIMKYATPLKKLVMRFALFLLVAVTLSCNPLSAQTGEYKRLQLSNGISLEVPSHWTILSQSTRNNLQAAGRAITENAGLEGRVGRKENILAVNSLPAPTGAMIRVSVTRPADYSQTDLAAMTNADLNEGANEMLMGFKKTEASGGPKVIQVRPWRIEVHNKYRTLVMPYTRDDKLGPSSWQVTQYKIPMDDRLIEITLSHRESDAIVWKPILEKVMRSISF